MKKLEFVELPPAEWALFEHEQANGGMLQSVEQFALLQDRGANVKILGLKRNGELVAGAVVTLNQIRGGKEILINHGPVLDYEDNGLLHTYLEHLKEYAKPLGGLYIKFSPNEAYQIFDNEGNGVGLPDEDLLNHIEKIGAIHLPFDKGMTATNVPSWIYEKDLQTLTEDTLTASYAPDVKYYLKKTQQFGVKLRELGRDELPEFKALTEDTAKRVGFADKPLEFYQFFYDNYGDRAHYVVAEINFVDYINNENDVIAKLDEKLTTLQERLAVKETKKNRGQFNEFTDQKQQHKKRIQKIVDMFGDQVPTTDVIVAGALFVEQPQEMSYLYSGMYEQYKEFFGPYLIQDTMMRKAIAAGLPKYNFLGISGDFDGTDGVFKFKKEFNGQPVQMLGEFEYPIRHLKHKMYKSLKRVLNR
ncbi:aminoacyltransferase [Weissella viridescens]|uniref:Aminoacyltransferase n=1 Tax=Weissella viridescens TaxID=1629 RepID=A0A3P2RJ68_WEIVI|nr:peptidoglycan bridge formation glycyltransferase FemA/FemB family protein [Weissella viridescens]RRG18790.1 aminoacyltransferase [Weissella viridescens]